MMIHNVEIRQQSRKSLALRITPDGLVAFIPQSLDPDSPRVQRFIEEGLERLPEPEPPAAVVLTREELNDLIARWANRLRVEVSRVQVREMRKKWASCSSRGNLTINRDVLQLPRDLVEYVICHELLHLKVPGHGRDWQMLMGVYMSDWREREKRLAGWVLQAGGK